MSSFAPSSSAAPASGPAVPAAQNAKRGWFARHRRLISAGLVIATVVGLSWALRIDRYILAALHWIGGLGPWAMAAFVGVYVLLSVVALPTSLLNIGAGLLFGVWWGFATSLVAATLSNVVCFLVARYAARDWIMRRLACKPKYAAMLKGLHRETWKVILLTRLNPVLPSAVAGYCFGLTKVKFRTYLSASVVGNAPLCLLLAYAGSVGHSLARRKGEHDATDYVLWGCGIVSTIGLAVWMTRYTTRKLREIRERDEATTGSDAGARTSETSPGEPLG